MTSYHIRNLTPQEDVKRGEKSAQTQEALIKGLFEAHPYIDFTPYEVSHILGLTLDLHCPITSIRRAMTNLTRKGILVKDEQNQKKGEYGAMNCTWSLNKDNQLRMLVNKVLRSL